MDPSRAGALAMAALATVGWLLLLGGVARAQLVAQDDRYGVPFAETLVVEASGVLENDTLDGEPAGENGATAELVADVSHGALALGADGAFTYTPGAGFTGSDAFSYRAVFGAVTSDPATVTLTACTGGPPLHVCWTEPAYLALAAQLGWSVFREGFESDAAWGDARSPDTAPAVTSRGIVWTTNHPATHEITTGGGPARTGEWGVFDPDHGVATGTPAECDVDVPPEHCLYHDGVTGTRLAGRAPLRGAGGFVTGTTGANLALILDGGTPVGLGKLPDPGHQFFGVIDAGAGFTSFELRELDGKVGQQRLVFADDFALVTEAPEPIPALPGWGAPTLAALLAAAAARRAAGRRRSPG